MKMMLTCKEASRLVSEALDRELPFKQRLALRFHLLMCRFCSRYGRQLRQLRAAIDRKCAREAQGIPSVKDAVPHSLSLEARERIKGALKP